MKLFSAKEMQRLDRVATATYGVKSLVLMENAGRGAAECIFETLKEKRFKRAVILCGKGNNGGDGYVIARHLKNMGATVSVVSLCSLNALKGDALLNALAWKKMGGETRVALSKAALKKAEMDIVHSSIVVDAMLGTGISSNVKGIYKDTIELLNELKKRVMAIDVPSGIDATTGKVLGSAIKACCTLTMAAPKTGLYLYPGREFAGRVIVIDIGMPKMAIKKAVTGTSLIDYEYVSEHVKPRKKDTHKGTYGHVLIIGGSVGKSGAVHLASLGALRSGAGLVTMAVPESINEIIEIKSTEAMSVPLTLTSSKQLGSSALKEIEKNLKGKDAVVIGPGIGNVDKGFIEGVLIACRRKRIPVVIDADALNNLDGLAEVLNECRKGLKAIITPHPGEAGRLLGVSSKVIQEDRSESSLKLSKSGAVTVLKGASSIIADGNEIAINPSGGPALASGGTGDVLSGMIASLIAQGKSCVDGAKLGVYLHGLSADELSKREGEVGISATEIADNLPRTIKSLTVQ